MATLKKIWNSQMPAYVQDRVVCFFTGLLTSKETSIKPYSSFDLNSIWNGPLSIKSKQIISYCWYLTLNNYLMVEYYFTHNLLDFSVFKKKLYSIIRQHKYSCWVYFCQFWTSIPFWIQTNMGTFPTCAPCFGFPQFNKMFSKKFRRSNLWVIYMKWLQFLVKVPA